MIRRIVFAVAIVLVAAGALAFRLPRLRLRPMHTDEANQAFKTGLLHDQGFYRYDLHEHHGPTLYYAALPAYWLSGARSFAESTETTHRIVPVLFGAGLVLLLLLIGDGVGRPAAVCAGILMAVSPMMLYYSRYYVQETLLVFFTFAAMATGWRYARSRRFLWAILCGASVGLMHATKETWVIAFGAMVAAIAVGLIWRACRARAVAEAEEAEPQAPSPAPRWRLAAHLAAGLAVAAGVSALLFSSFFTNPDGPRDSVAAYRTYLDRSGEKGPHEHPPGYYLSLLMFAGRTERPWWATWGLVGFLAALYLAGVAAGMKRRGAPIERGPRAPRILAVATILLAAAFALMPWVQGLRETAQERERLAAAEVKKQAKSTEARTSDETDWHRHTRAVRHYLGTFGQGQRYGGPWWSEALIIGLCVAGIAAAKTRAGVAEAQVPFVRFLAVYTVAMTLAYSMIPYKTPWCALGFLHGMILLAGVGAVAVVRILPTVPLKALACLILAAATFQLGGEAYRGSYQFSADPRNPAVYAHTSTNILDLVKRIDDLADLAPEGKENAVIVVIAPAHDYWPLPWYLRHLNQDNIGYYAEPPQRPHKPHPDKPEAAVIIFPPDLQEAVDERIGRGRDEDWTIRDSYFFDANYGLRPGVILWDYVRADIWEAFIMQRSKHPPDGSPPSP